MQAQSPQPSAPKPLREFKIAPATPPPAWHRQRRAWLVAVAVAALVAVLALVAMPGRVEVAASRFGAVTSGSLSLGISGYGKLIPSGLVVITSPSGGRVVRIETDIGTQLNQ